MSNKETTVTVQDPAALKGLKVGDRVAMKG